MRLPAAATTSAMATWVLPAPSGLPVGVFQMRERPQDATRFLDPLRALADSEGWNILLTGLRSDTPRWHDEPPRSADLTPLVTAV